MALIDRDAAAHVDTSTARFASQVSGGVPTGLYAGEDLDGVAACYISTADGKVYMSDGTANNAAAKFHGVTPVDYRTGEPVTIYGPGTRFGYGNSMVPGKALYVAATKGRLNDAATTAGLTPIAFTVSATDIVIAAYVL